MRTHGLGLILGAVSGTALSISSAHAGGFMLQEQSQVEIGRAFSGAAAAADPVRMSLTSKVSAPAKPSITIIADEPLQNLTIALEPAAPEAPVQA